MLNLKIANFVLMSACSVIFSAAPAGGCPVVIANTHILFNPKRGDIKVNPPQDTQPHH